MPGVVVLVEPCLGLGVGVGEVADVADVADDVLLRAELVPEEEGDVVEGADGAVFQADAVAEVQGEAFIEPWRCGAFEGRPDERGEAGVVGEEETKPVSLVWCLRSSPLRFWISSLCLSYTPCC